MRRSILALLLFALAALVAPNPTAAQSSDQPRVYEMYFKIDFPDVPTWVEFYQTHEVPVLEALVDEGILRDFDLWIHDTGGEFNVRYNIVAPNWDAIGDFVDAYYSRLDMEAMQEVVALAREHVDQIWAIGPNSFPEGWREESSLVYESAYELDPAGAEEWNAEFLEYGQPALERAVEEGHIQAWAALGHDTGGPYNAKFVYWLEEWDQTDDALAFLAEARDGDGGSLGHPAP